MTIFTLWLPDQLQPSAKAIIGPPGPSLYLGPLADDTAADAKAAALGIVDKTGYRYLRTSDDQERVWVSGAWANYDQAAQDAVTAAGLEADRAEAAADDVATTVQTAGVLGVVAGQTLVSGTTASAAATRRFRNRYDRDFVATSIDWYNPSGSSGTIKLRVFDAAGVQVGSDVSVVIPNGNNTGIAVNFTVPANHYWGFYYPASKISYTAGTLTEGGTYGSSGDQTTIAVTGIARNDTQFQMRLNGHFRTVTDTRFSSTKTTTDAAAGATRATQVLVGRQSNPVTGTSLGQASTMYFNRPALADGRITGVKVYGGATAGRLVIRVGDLSGGNIVQRDIGVSVPVTNGTLNTITGLNIRYRKGQYLGFYAPVGIATFAADTPPDDAGYGRFSTSSGDVSSVSAASESNTTTMQVQFICEEGLPYTALDADVALAKVTQTPAYIGSQAALGAGNATLNAALNMFAEPRPLPGRIIGFEAYCASTTDNLSVRIGTESGGTITSRDAYSFVMGAGLKTVTGLDIPYDAGEYLGVYAPTGVLRYTTSQQPDVRGRFQQAGTNQDTVSTASEVLTSRIEFRFLVEEGPAFARDAAKREEVRLRRALNLTGIYACDAAVRSMDAPLNSAVLLAFDGNSHFADNGYTPPSERLPSLWGLTEHNFGVGGQTTQQMSADAAAQVDAILSGSKMNVLCVQEIYNDIRVNNLTPQQGVDNLETYCNARRSAGWDIILIANLRDVVGNRWGSGGFTEGFVEDVNALLAAQYSGFADALVDLTSVESFNDCFDRTVFRDDGVHLNEFGRAVETVVWAEAIVAALP